MKDLAYQIFQHFAEKGVLNEPNFAYLWEACLFIFEAEKPADIIMMANAVTEAQEKWTDWACEWSYEAREAKAQDRWELANRGEI